MTMTCPCCRAINETPPLCRRCKADLCMLFDLESQRVFHIAEAQRSLSAGDSLNASTHLRQASSLRDGDDLRKLNAVTSLLNRDFATAYAAYHALRSAS
ncbi:hypothetical protein BH11PLA2_BH11PLA2_08090 [soil metagenome]